MIAPTPAAMLARNGGSSTESRRAREAVTTGSASDSAVVRRTA
jgi:hypothetical protein